MRAIKALAPTTDDATMTVVLSAQFHYLAITDCQLIDYC